MMVSVEQALVIACLGVSLYLSWVVSTIKDKLQELDTLMSLILLKFAIQQELDRFEDD
jgi:hypothetical protein